MRAVLQLQSNRRRHPRLRRHGQGRERPISAVRQSPDKVVGSNLLVIERHAAFFDADGKNAVADLESF